MYTQKHKTLPIHRSTRRDSDSENRHKNHNKNNRTIAHEFNVRSFYIIIFMNKKSIISKKNTKLEPSLLATFHSFSASESIRVRFGGNIINTYAVHSARPHFCLIEYPKPESGDSDMRGAYLRLICTQKRAKHSHERSHQRVRRWGPKNRIPGTHYRTNINIDLQPFSRRALSPLAGWLAGWPACLLFAIYIYAQVL